MTEKTVDNAFVELLAPTHGWMVMFGLMVLLVGAGKAWASRQTHWPTHRRRAAFLLGWIGMDANAFAQDVAVRPSMVAWCHGAGALALAALLAFVAVPAVEAACPGHPWMAGVPGMMALLCLFHFGVFQILSCLWRALGVAAMPIMDQPWRSDSLADFWSRRWNLAFRDLAFALVFRPAVRKWGTGWAMALVYLASGLAHEMVISIPACGGWSGPTGYFVIQGCGVFLERRWRNRGMGRPLPRRIFLWLVVLGPVLLLFPPVFLERVILPFLHLIRVPTC